MSVRVTIARLLLRNFIGHPFRPLIAPRLIQTPRHDRERALHVVDDVAAAGVDVADQHTPAALVAGVGFFAPEAQDEDLVERRPMSAHECSPLRAIAWRELGRLSLAWADGRGSVAFDPLPGCGVIECRSRENHGPECGRRNAGSA